MLLWLPSSKLSWGPAWWCASRPSSERAAERGRVVCVAQAGQEPHCLHGQVGREKGKRLGRPSLRADALNITAPAGAAGAAAS